MDTTRRFLVILAATLAAALPLAAEQPRPLFNGRDFTGWKVPAGDNGHWKVIDGVIDYDAASEAAGDKSLWTEGSYRDFVLRLDWRIKATPYVNPNVFIIRHDGSRKKDAEGRDIRLSVPDSDSGIYLRGSTKAQVNIWGWPIGSGEVYGYRTDQAMPAAVRAGVTPGRHADRNIGDLASAHGCAQRVQRALAPVVQAAALVVDAVMKAQLPVTTFVPTAISVDAHQHAGCQFLHAV